MNFKWVRYKFKSFMGSLKVCMYLKFTFYDIQMAFTCIIMSFNLYNAFIKYIFLFASIDKEIRAFK